MKKKLLIMVLTTLLYGSCNQESVVAQPYPTTKNIVKLTDKNMPAVEYFSLKKINLPEKYVHSQYHVYNDSIVIIVNERHPQPYIVTFYNLNTKKELAGFFKKGNGPYEMVSASGKMCCNYLAVLDYSTHAISRLNIDSVLTEGKAYKPFITRLDCFMVSDFAYCDENTITMPNSMYVSNAYGVDGLSEFVQYDAKTGKPLAKYKQNDKNFPSNLLNRTIAFSGTKYYVFWFNYPIITIYDKNFNLLKMYRDEKFKDPEIIVEEPYSELLADGDNNFALYIAQTDNYIFAKSGRFQMTRSEVKNKGNKWRQSDDYNLTRAKNQEIWCFDNEMNFVRRFKCNNKVGLISNSSYNEKSKKLFVTAMDEEDEYCLYECIFKK